MKKADAVELIIKYVTLRDNFLHTNLKAWSREKQIELDDIYFAIIEAMTKDENK